MTLAVCESINARHILTTPSHRYLALDLARGLALIGVALINVHSVAVGWDSFYSLDLAESRVDIFAEYIVGLVFTHRAFPTLAFLFGAGLVMQWQRLDPDTRRVSQLRPRLYALLLLGIAHGLLLWPGDIVSTYAIIGVVILLGWPHSDVRAKFLASFVAIVAIALTAFAVAAWLDAGDVPPLESTPTSFAQSKLIDALVQHGSEFFSYGLAQLLVPEVWAAALFGVWVTQSGRLTAWLRGETDARAWMMFGVGMFVVAAVLDVLAARYGGWNHSPTLGTGVALQIAAAPPGMVGSVFVLLGLARYWAAGQRSLLRDLIEAAGKTPLTQFFGQSVVFAGVFNESIVGGYGELSRAEYSCVAIATYFLWAGFARAWLASGRARGPVEVVWVKLASQIAR